MEFFTKDNTLNIVSNSKTNVFFDMVYNNLKIENLDITFPWEYEKWWILAEVIEFQDTLFYSLTIDLKHIVIIYNDKFEQSEKILSFFWDVDVLIIIWSKDSTKIFENIEARIVIPYWQWKEIFLNSLWQNIEKTKVYKLKWDLPENVTEFINLE